MKTYILAIIGITLLIASVGLVTAGYGRNMIERQYLGEDFVDEDGDGVCDNWVDEDGDGFNDLRPLDGTGHQYRRGERQGLGPRDGTGFGKRNCHAIP